MPAASFRHDVRQLLTMFHQPRRTLAGIGERPGILVVFAALLLLGFVAKAGTVASGNWIFGERESLLWGFVVVSLRPFITSAVYVFVFGLFGAEARYRVVLSVVLHATWVFAVLAAGLVLISFLVDAPPFAIRDHLVSSIGLSESYAHALAQGFHPLEIGRLLLTGLGFPIALGVSRRMSFGIVFAGWLASVAFPLLTLGSMLS